MRRVHRKIAIYVIVLLIVGIIAANFEGYVWDVQKETSDSILFLDPGHGGIDGGAVSSTGIPEKDINLSIAQKVKQLAERCGWQVVMTRIRDEGLYQQEEGSIRSLKTQDLKARQQLLQEYHPEIALSIHLNSFKEDPSVKGVQIFYPDEGGSQTLLDKSKQFAEVMQQSLDETLQNENKRIPLAKDGVFLLQEVVCPIIIVECGFLSNPEEAAQLQSERYQQQIADGIMDGIMNFTGKKKKLPEIIDSL